MRSRIVAIDAMRGFLLLNIFANHLSASMLQRVSPSRLSFADSADAFVLIAGISSYLAYADLADSRGTLGMASRIWRRAATLYLTNLIVVGASILFFAATWNTLPLIPDHAITLLESDPLKLTFELSTLRQSIGYSMVLRLYVLIMLVAPCYIWLGRRKYWYPIVPAALVWLVSGSLGLVEHDSITGTPLALTFLPWNLVFAIGVALGAGIKAGIKVPRHGVLIFAATAVIIGSFVFAAYICRVYQPAMDWAVTRNDEFLSGASKSLQSPLRVANILALTYIFAVCKGWPVIRLFHQARETSYLAKMGRNSLPVFATGAVLAVIGDTLLVNAIGYRGGYDLMAVATEATVVVCACFAMKMVADRFERKRIMRREVFDQSGQHLPVPARSNLF